MRKINRCKHCNGHSIVCEYDIGFRVECIKCYTIGILHFHKEKAIRSWNKGDINNEYNRSRKNYRGLRKI